MSDKAITREEFEAVIPPKSFMQFNETLGRYVLAGEKGYTSQQTNIRVYNHAFGVWKRAKEQYAPRENRMQKALESLDWAIRELGIAEKSHPLSVAQDFHERLNEAKALIGDKE